jgi:hypothetical protein
MGCVARSQHVAAKERLSKGRVDARSATRDRLDGAQPSRVELYVKIAIVAGLFAGLSWSPNLWLSDRLYPLTPVWRFLGPIPAPLDHIIST